MLEEPFFTQPYINNYKQQLDPKYSGFDFEIPQDRRITRTYLDQLKMSCSGIGDEYLKQSLEKSLLFLSENQQYFVYQIVVLKKGGQVCGFMIVKKGLCVNKPDVYGLSLICTAGEKCKGGGTLLVGLFLYIILANNNIGAKQAVLELAGGFTNKTGLCLYEKFGFRQDMTLFGDDCFNDYDNLPMYNDFSVFTGNGNGNENEEKIRSLIRVVNGQEVPTKSQFCSKQLEGKEEHLQRLKNILLIMDYYKKLDANINANIDQYIDNIKNDDFKHVYNHVKTFLEDKDNNPNGNEKTFLDIYDYIKGAIDYMEGDVDQDVLSDYLHTIFPDEDDSDEDSDDSMYGGRRQRRSRCRGRSRSRSRSRSKIQKRKTKRQKKIKKKSIKRIITKRRRRSSKNVRKGKTIK